MGSSSSKVARGATRKYPTRAPGAAVPTPPPPRPRPAAKPKAKTLGGGAKDEGIHTRSVRIICGRALTCQAVRADSMDPDFPTGDFSRRLQQMGIAQPNPTYSPSSTAASQLGPKAPRGPSFAPSRSNPTLTALEARQRLQEEAEEDFAAIGRGVQGRRFLDMRTVVDAMKLRDRGVADEEIESRLRIQPGLLARLGRQGTFSHVTSP
ncbi:hypothetical protein FALBO_441 [Fusarium albosuccineum]|uniref:Helix-turn-helix domain-containing protein n=1 Tax=Fusarium albosuccineum TaxID=1237068 RepID=A0A8H4PMC6_9HYPO|nr:hypothetical protein FALBO_441 [Fusarium albosuccineum]